ncbi:MAG: HAD hydrolase-like protein [Alphaproteobacteria bacterium]|nr:HAD hydrolase-like protein [Alphaproteobacteria bacterium]
MINMNQKLKYVSRIKDEFDTVISGVNGVFTFGNNIDSASLDTLIKIYQSGKKIALASNTAMRAKDLYRFLKHSDVPMNIFYALITAGEIAHFYLKNHHDLGRTYYNLSGNHSKITENLEYQPVESPVMADFILAESDSNGLETSQISSVLEQSLYLRLPLLCIGNNTALVGEKGIVTGVGAIAEQYAMMGGQVISFGKPDVRIASYLLEGLKVDKSRCLVIGDCMSTDMRMGSHFGAKTLLLTNGVHKMDSSNIESQLNSLSENYGLTIDYYMEQLQW